MEVLAEALAAVTMAISGTPFEVADGHGGRRTDPGRRRITFA
jgi:hypothetical protein